MRKITIMVVAMFVLALAGTLTGQEKPKIVMKTAPDVDVNDPAAMFQAYCAACHGKQGKGDGPAAAALKAVPADLTRINARNGGKFPTVKVRRYIEGLDEISAHGSRDMPVWGQVFRGVATGGQAGIQLRVEALTKYLESIQQQ
jgi:mono/diheme cytochrome c family protein